MNLYDVYSLYNVTPVMGKGAYIHDDKGIKYLDFYGGHAVISVGHTHPHYIQTIKSQLEKINFYSNSVQNPLQHELADKLATLSGLSNYDLFLINSGAEANENALKLASFYNNRKKVLALNNSFHGRTSAAINVTHTGRKHQAPINHGADVTYCPFTEIDSILNEINTGAYTAIIIEAIQGVGGLDMIDPLHLQKIRKACNKTDTILILDEVQCGYGRSGDFFAFESSDILPDIITIAKGMGNGFPIGGVLINAEKIPPVKSRLGTTYGGNHLACAAGIAVLDIIKEENLVANAAHMGILLKDQLVELPMVQSVKGRGLMLGLELEFPISEFRKKLIYDYHIFTGNATNPNLLRILPPLSITENEISLFLDGLRKCLKSIPNS